MSTYGYGSRTMVQGLAAICCRLAKYITKHDARLKTFLPPAAYSCITGTAACLASICQLKNRSAT